MDACAASQCGPQAGDDVGRIGTERRVIVGEIGLSREADHAGIVPEREGGFPCLQDHHVDGAVARPRAQEVTARERSDGCGHGGEVERRPLEVAMHEGHRSLSTSDPTRRPPPSTAGEAAGASISA